MSAALVPLDRLSECEAVIQHGFEDAGRALMEIRDERLYREQYATFEDYCRQRWGFNRAQANRQINAVKVAGYLDPIGSKPTIESQARELATLLDREDAAEVVPAVWREVQERHEGHVTAASVRDAVRRHLGGSLPAPTAEPRLRPTRTNDVVVAAANRAYRSATGAMTEVMRWPLEAVAEGLGPESTKQAIATTQAWSAWLTQLQELLNRRTVR